MSINNFSSSLFIFIILIGLLTACTQPSQISPTPDAGAIATQMWMDLAVQQTLSASISTSTPLPTQTPTPVPGLVFISTPITPPNDPSSNHSVENPIDKMQLAYIPAGNFIMGTNINDHDMSEDELPQHEEYLDAFWISTTEVTNSEFNACVNAGVCEYSVSLTTNPHYLDPVYAYHPVVYVSWEDAQKYCSWTGGRLPTEAEWEKAARGTNGQRFAWGEEHPNIKYVNAANEYGTTTNVRGFAYGISPYGVFDMGGNVREWVNDWYDPAYYQYSPKRNPVGPESGERKVLKGADFHDEYRFCRAANRLAHEPQSPGNERGFRCVYP